MRVLVACEYSGIMRDAFIENGTLVPIDGFDGYLVSSDGSVYGCKTNKGFRSVYRKLRPSTDAKGYLGLTLCGNGGKRRKVRIHRLIAEVFIPNPKSLPCVRHLDGSRTNNSVCNLSWGSYADNEQDKKQHGTWELRRNGKLSISHREDIFFLKNKGYKNSEIARLYNVSRPTISRLINGKTWGTNS